MEWKYDGDFNEMAGMLIYGITMKYLVDEGSEDEVNNSELMAAAADEIGLTHEKLADAMIQAGKQLKEAVMFEKAAIEFTEMSREYHNRKRV